MAAAAAEAPPTAPSKSYAKEFQMADTSESAPSFPRPAAAPPARVQWNPHA